MENTRAPEVGGKAGKQNEMKASGPASLKVYQGSRNQQGVRQLTPHDTHVHNILMSLLNVLINWQELRTEH